MGGVIVTTYEVDTKLTEYGCMNKYVALLDDIEKKIEELNIKEDIENPQECDELVKYINKKYGELAECHKQKLLNRSFNFKEELKGFLNNYDKYYQCLRKSASPFKEPIELKTSCEENQDFNEGVARTEEGEAETEIESPSLEDNSEAQGSLELIQSKADEEKSKEQSAISAFQSTKMPYDKAEGPDTQTSGEGTYQYSRITSLNETPSQPIVEGDHSAPNESGKQSSIHSEKIGSNGDVVSSLTLEVSDLSKSISSASSITYPSVSGEIEGNLEEQDSPPNVQSFGSKTIDGKVHAVEGTGDENSMGKVSDDLAQDRRVTENADTAVRATTAVLAVVQDPDDEGTCSEVFNDETHSHQTSQIEHIAPQSLSNSESSDIDLSIQNLVSVNSEDYSSQNTSYSPSVESASVFKNPHSSEPSSESHSNSYPKVVLQKKKCNVEGQCTQERLQKPEYPNPKEPSCQNQPTLSGKDICTNYEESQQGKSHFEKGGGSYEPSEEMPYKNYIYIGIVILGIIFLLSFLLKFTPLGLMFSNKRKKRRKNIQERLQRVLLQPPYDNEGNVSLAYGNLESFV